MIIRKATAEDAPFVAWTVMTALDLDTSELEKATKVCGEDDSMYSWKNSLIAEENSEQVGCIVSYCGDDYARMREYTWPKIWSEIDPEIINNTPHETQAGEYYLDSMAIVAEARGRGTGKELIKKAIEIGREKGYRDFCLIVDVEKPKLRKYYEELGFRREKEMTFLTHRFHKMKKKI